jgi:hypothetical protein
VVLSGFDTQLGKKLERLLDSEGKTFLKQNAQTFLFGNCTTTLQHMSFASFCMLSLVFAFLARLA